MAARPREEAADGPKRSRTLRNILIGAVLGILTGIVFGQRTHVLEPLANGYVLLITAVVYPYIVASLLTGLGGMSVQSSARLFKRAWPLYVTVWVLTLGTIAVLSVALPDARQILFYPSRNQTVVWDKLVSLIVPSDPFSALSHHAMSSVVVFFVLFGIALQFVDDRQPLLDNLNIVSRACLRFWSWTTPFAPFAVFVLLAITAGKVSAASLTDIGFYLGLHTFGALALAFVILPLLLTALAPIGYREALADLKEPIIVVLATASPPLALPHIAEMIRKNVERCGLDEGARSSIERMEVINVNMSIAFVIGVLGNLFVYLFVLFASQEFGVVINTVHQLSLPFVIVLSAVGSAAASLKFIDGWLGMPIHSVDLFLETGVITRYSSYALSVVGLAFLGITVTLNYYGKLRLRPRRLAACLAVSLVLLGGGTAILQWLHSALGKDAVASYLDFSIPDDVRQNVKLAADTGGTVDLMPHDGETVFEHIHRTGVLRVGVNDGGMPFVFHNRAGKLAGYDIAFAYDLAHALGVKLRFVRFSWADLTKELRQHRFDIAMAGLYMTDRRLRQLTVSDPYLISPPALLGPRSSVSRLMSADPAVRSNDLHIAVFNDDVLEAEIKRWLPNASFTVVGPFDASVDFSRYDAAVWTLAQAQALARLHSNLAVAVPTGLGDPLVFVYLMPPHADRLRIFVDGMIRRVKATGWQDRELKIWIYGRFEELHQRRWNVLDDVLGLGGGAG